MPRIPIRKPHRFFSPIMIYFTTIFIITLILPITIALVLRPFTDRPQLLQPQIDLESIMKNSVFPIPKGFSYSFINDFGTLRTSGNKPHSHQGIDIMAERNTPVIAIEDCIIDKIGWDNSGGNRINMLSIDKKRRYYYAHLEDFSPELKQSLKIKRGTVLGFIGSSGYGPPGSDTGTKPHLHIQIWLREKDYEELINPYQILKYLEK